MNSDISPPSPVVTVLMSIYNAEAYLRETMDSILGQTFTDFEFLIFNDGSTDTSAAIVRSYADPRIIFIDYEVNRGYCFNFNEGLAVARGRYLARMDGDDVAHPERLAKQVAYLEDNPGVGLCGSAVRYIGASSGIVELPVDNQIIRQTLWLRNAFFHPAIIMRVSILHTHSLRYNVDYEPAEDYKLWTEMSMVTEVHNLPDVLLDYRIHPHQISRQQSLKQQQVTAQIRQEQMSHLGIELRPEQIATFQLLTINDGWPTLTTQDYHQIAALLRNLGEQAQRVGIAPAVVYRVLSQQWGRILEAAWHYQITLLPLVLKQPFRDYLPPVLLAKLTLKCLIGWRVKPTN